MTTNYHASSYDMDNTLIRTVYMFPEIYDGKSGRKRKETAWKKISEHVCVPVALCRRRWKGLRDTYIRELKKEKLAVKSGEGVGPRRRWRYTAHLAFLNPLIKGFEDLEPPGGLVPPGDLDHWTGTGGRGVGGGGGDHTEPEVTCYNGRVGRPTEIEVKTEDIPDEPDTEWAEERDAGGGARTLSEPSAKQSSAELFCRSLVPHLERLPLEKLLQVQLRILQVVQDATGS